MALPASAQSPLSLSEAIARAKARNPDAGSAAAAEREAAERVTQARGGYFPKVDVAESWQRGNHPVFVFSSLLAQRQFTAADFALDALNHPDATDNFRTAFSVEQSLFDRTTSANVRAASIGRDMAATGKRLVDHDLTAAVTDAFGRVLIAAATVRSAAAAVETARADRELAGNRRDAGRVTDADVLQLDVYLARTLEQQVQATSDERIARARLNQLMGEPLSTMFSLDLTPPAIAIDITNPAGLEEEASEEPARSRARHAAGTAGGRHGGRGEGGVSAASGRAGRVGTERRRLEFAVVELGGWRGRPDQPVPWFCRQGHGSLKRASRRRVERSKRARPRPWRGSMCRSRSPGSRPRGRAKRLDGRPPIRHERAAASSGTAMRAASRMRPCCCARPTPCSRPMPNKSLRV